VERHLAIVVDRRGDAMLQAHSRYALRSALSGGYPARVRLEILRGLETGIDPSLQPLLERHARDLIEELESKGEHDLATRARSLPTSR